MTAEIPGAFTPSDSEIDSRISPENETRADYPDDGHLFDDPVAASETWDSPELPEDFLEPEADIDLARSPAFYRQAYKEPLLTAAEEVELKARIDRGDEAARERFIKANLRLVMHVARRPRLKAWKLDYDDLVAEGTFGLTRAIEKFDTSRGYKFSTYAYHWIQQSVDRAISNQDRTIRLPVHVAEIMGGFARAARKLERELSREPTDEEVAKEAGVSLARLHAIKDMSKSPVSLDAPIDPNDQNSETLIDTVGDSSPGLAEELLETENTKLRARVQTAIVTTLEEGYTEREQQIIKQRYGLDGGEAKTLDEISKVFGITRERVRQISTKVGTSLVPSVRVMLADQGLLSEDEATFARQELASLELEDRPTTFKVADRRLKQMIKLAEEIYDGEEKEVVEDLLERCYNKNWFTKALELQLIDSLQEPDQRQDSLEVFKAEYMGIALIAAAPHVQAVEAACPDNVSVVVSKVEEALERVVSDNLLRVTGPALRDRIFRMAGITSQTMASELLPADDDELAAEA